MKKMITLHLLLLAAALFTGCRKNPASNLTVEESWVYISSGQNGINFSSFQTFTIPDSVILISNRQGSNNYETNALARSMVSEIRNQMQLRGFTFTTKNNNPDIGISVSRIDNSYTNVAAINGWWDPAWGYWDPAFWGYPGFGWAPTQFVFYNTNETAWAVDLIDLKNVSNNSLRIVWSGTIRGENLFSTGNTAALASGLFSIAPYIKRN
jgi:Domain of unknown function (DUF4136)